MTQLQTARLLIRYYKPSDLADMHRLWSDKRTMYYLDDIWCDTLEDTVKSLEYGMACADGHYFAICDKMSGAYMGSIGYTITDATPLGKIAHMGYMLLSEHHGRGYMPEAVKETLAFAFTRDGCIRVTSGCHKENDASRKVLEKAGFRREGERVKAVYHDGVMKDRLEYGVNREEYLSN
jgi:ribosomal-protein-alanine N-acetyltransferase